jgi:hypothetical protein
MLDENPVYRRIWEISSKRRYGNDRLIVHRAVPREVIPGTRYEWQLFSDGAPIETIALDVSLPRMMQIDDEVQCELSRTPSSDSNS